MFPIDLLFRPKASTDETSPLADPMATEAGGSDYMDPSQRVCPSLHIGEP